MDEKGANHTSSIEIRQAFNQYYEALFFTSHLVNIDECLQAVDSRVTPKKNI